MSSACSIILFAIRTKNEYIKILFGILNCVIFKRIFFYLFILFLFLFVCVCVEKSIWNKYLTQRFMAM